MLQWMGGSRRKVTTARKSSQKRQKQYFEQRKRQQQQTAGLDSYADHKEHRSLDVLSLLNLSTTAEEPKCVCPSEELKVNASIMKYPITKSLPKIFTNTATFAESAEYQEAGTPSSYQAKPISPKNVSFTEPDNENNVFNGSSKKPDPWKTTTDQQISVFDLLADDGPSGNLEGSPIHEAHVSFSIEGLGRVGTQTPMHSPQQPGRIFQYGCFSPQKTARRPNLSKNFDLVLDDLELEVDVMTDDMNMPLRDSNLEFSSGVMNFHSNREQKYSTVNNCASFDGYNSKLESSFGDSVFHGTRNNIEDLRNARSSFLDDNFLNEKEFGASGRNWLGQMEGIDFLNYGNEISDYAFECPPLPKNRVSVKASDRYNMLDSPTPEQQTLEINDDIITSKMTRYPAAGMNFDFGEPTSPPNWSNYKGAKDDLSLLSEESCSSSAVSGEARNKSPSNSTARQKRGYENNFGREGNMYGLRCHVKETRCKTTFDILKGSYTCGSEKCTKMPILSLTKQFHCLNSPLEEKFGPQKSWLFEEGYASADVIADFNSFCQTSEAKFPSLGSKPQKLDPFSGFPALETCNEAKSSFDMSKYSQSVEYSSLGSNAYEKFPFCKPSHKNSNDSSTCPNIEFVSTKPILSLDCELGSVLPASFHVAGLCGDTQFPDWSAEESITKDDESKSKTQPTNCKKFELGKENCNQKNCFLSENETANASKFDKNMVEYKKVRDGTSKQKGGAKTAPSPEHIEEASSSVEKPDKFEQGDDKES